MAAKTFRISMTPPTATQLCRAIRTYAQVAYPMGGSECAQVARETLMNAADSIEEQVTSAGEADVSRRLRAMLKAAIKWYFGEQQPNQNVQKEMLKLLGKKA